ncbi:hypothetical protein T459_08562 [Capsicum annuum]|uniref:Uncharacterized protein n=1 Tax=Capsicum annuum TaxID=4072 RepID=A0A2G2ZWY0_CAPAN|nr:hypothetical protein T459_08562 [Capsicum annuum]
MTRKAPKQTGTHQKQLDILAPTYAVYELRYRACSMKCRYVFGDQIEFIKAVVKDGVNVDQEPSTESIEKTMVKSAFKILQMEGVDTSSSDLENVVPRVNDREMDLLEVLDATLMSLS